MARFFVTGIAIDLPAVPVQPRSPSRDDGAWQFGSWFTVRLLSPVEGLRVHTNGRAFPGREASREAGAWIAIGDVLMTSSELASTRSLPTKNVDSMAAFTHVSVVDLPAQCVLNIGIASAKWAGAGGGVQAEHVSGPPLTFVEQAGKHWHGRAGHA